MTVNTEFLKEILAKRNWSMRKLAYKAGVSQATLSRVFNGKRGVEARTTEGGSYLFVKLPEMEISMHEFIKILRIKANVTVTPGTEFGPQFINWFRINFSQDHCAAVEAMSRIIKMMELFRI